MVHALNSLMNQPVEVDASGTLYHGVLRGITEEAVVLWSDEGWCSIPHERVNAVRPDRPKPTLARRRRPSH